MLYTVECNYADPKTEEQWNDFYSREKLPALISVDGFMTSQRFKALTPGCPVYLAIHTIREAQTITSQAYQQQGGGNFATWQAWITDWHRNLYECEETAPAVAQNEILLLTPQRLGFVESELGYYAWEMHAAGLDNNPVYRVAYAIQRDKTWLFAGLKQRYLYEPITEQLKNAD